MVDEYNRMSAIVTNYLTFINTTYDDEYIWYSHMGGAKFIVQITVSINSN